MMFGDRPTIISFLVPVGGIGTFSQIYNAAKKMPMDDPAKGGGFVPKHTMKAGEVHIC